MKPDDATSSSFRRSRSLSFRRKAVPRSSRSSTIDDTVRKNKSQLNSRSDNDRLKVLLENLDTRFTECTFTYKESHLSDQPSATATKKRSRLSALRNQIFGSMEKLREAITCEKCYTKCLFVPTAEKEKVKEFVRRSFPDIKLTFEDCKFVKRSSTLPEKIRRNLRTFFGIQFELEYINSVATINDYTFRLKDIPVVNQHIQERIAEEG